MSEDAVLIPLTFSRLCLIWYVCVLPYALTTPWWVGFDFESPPTTLFGSKALYRFSDRMAVPLFDAGCVLMGLGIVLALIYLAKERRMGRNSALVISGLAYMILAVASGIAVILVSAPNEDLIPMTSWPFIWLGIGIVIMANIGCLCGIRWFVRRYGAPAAEEPR